MERRNAAKRGVIAYTDVLDQAREKLLLLVDINPMQLLIFQVDKVQQVDEVIVATRSDGTTAIAFSKLYPWYTVSNDLVNLQEYETVMRARAADDKILGDLRKEIGPTHEEDDRPMPGQFI